jgi:hypothetical protein
MWKTESAEVTEGRWRHANSSNVNKLDVSILHKTAQLTRMSQLLKLKENIFVRDIECLECNEYVTPNPDVALKLNKSL